MGAILCFVGGRGPFRDTLRADDGTSRSVVWISCPTAEWKPEIASVTLREDVSFYSGFIKQLRRQAVLIAARDELGALTRDEFLSETAPDGAVKIEELDRFLVDNLEYAGALFAQNVEHVSFLAEVEKRSRNELVAALEKAGVSRTPTHQDETDSENVEEATTLHFSLIPQWDEVRRLHAGIHEKGETPGRLVDLVRAYTQLQLLTNAALRDTHRVFQARAMLYAQRLVAKYGDSPEARAIRAAAWSLNNFHRLALEEFDAIPQDTLADDSWVQSARLYAEYDIKGLDRLIESQGDRPERSFPKLLKFFLLDYTDNGPQMTRSYGMSIIADLPDCARLYQPLFAYEGNVPQNAPNGSLFDYYLSRQIAPAIRKMENIPPEVSKAGQELRKKSSGDPGNEPGEGFYSGLAELLKTMNESTPETDPGEPSMQALSTLLQDETFYTVLQVALKRGNPDAVIDQARAALESHPLMNHLGLVYRDGNKKEGYKKKLREFRIPYERLSQLRLGFNMPENGIWAGEKVAPFVLNCRYADRENVRDMILYHQETRWYVPRDTPLFTVRCLERICPNSPFAVKIRLERSWEFNEKEADAIAHDFGEYPNVREKLVEQLLKNNRRDKAIDVLRNQITPHYQYDQVMKIANLSIEQGDADGTIEFIQDCLDKPEEIQMHDRERAGLQLLLGRLLVKQGKYKEADPCFSEAVRHGVQGAVLMRARYLEIIQKTGEAERIVRENMQRDHNPFPWWAVCFRTNHDRLAAATNHLYDTMMQYRDKNNKDHRDFRQLYYAFFCMGIPMKEEFGDDPSVRVFFQYNRSVPGFLAVFEALENKDQVKADTLLLLLQGRGSMAGKAELAHTLGKAKLPPGQENPKIETEAFRILAALFDMDLRSEKPGSPDEKTVEELLRIAYKNLLDDDDMLAILHLLGRYYNIHGEYEKGFECFRRICGAKSLQSVYPLCFALKELRDAGFTDEDYMEWVRTEAELPHRPADAEASGELARKVFERLDDIRALRSNAQQELPDDTAYAVRRCMLPATDVFSDISRWYTIPKGELERQLDGSFFLAAWSSDGKRIATSGYQCSAALWNAETGEKLAELPNPNGSRGSAVAFTPDNVSILYGGAQGEVGIWTPKIIAEKNGEDEKKDLKQTPDWQVKEHGWTSSVCFSPDGKIFCSASEDDKKRGVVLWNAESRRPLRMLKTHQLGVHAVAFYSDGNRLVTASKDKTATVFNVKTGRPIFVLQGHQETVRAVAVSPGDRLIATGGTDDTVILWDAQTGKPLKILGMYNGDIVSLSFSPDGSKLAVGRNFHGEGTFIFDTKTWKPIAFLSGSGPWNCQTAWSPDSRRIVTCGERGTRIWRMPGDVVPAEEDEKLAGLNEVHLKELTPEQFFMGDEKQPKFEPFRSSRREYPESLWAHAPSQIVYRLDGRWETFKTTYGIRIGADMSQASCFFIALGDGKELFRSEMIRDNLDRPLELDVRNVRRLELIVDPNQNNYNDHGVWFEPKLYRETPNSE